MNVLGNNDKKKAWIIGGAVFAVIVILVSVLMMTGGSDKNKNKEKDNVSSLIKDIENGTSWSDRGDYVYNNDKNENPDKSQNNIPLVHYGGVFESYEDYNTYAEIKLGIKDKEVVSFRMYPDSIVFDVNKKEVIIPSSLKTFKGNTRVIALEDIGNGLPRVEAVIVNDVPDLLYVKVTDKADTDKGVLLFDDKNKKAYVLDKKSKVFNALTKTNFDSEFKEGDKLFILPRSGFKQEKVDLKDNEMYGILDVKELYVYPSKE